MMKLLVVEDDQDKLRRVMQCLLKCDIDENSIEIARDVVSAKRALLEASFDLMILDISLPENLQSKPIKDGGIRLLDEIFERDIYRAPREIVGLTAFEDVLESVGARFSEQLWSVIKYDISTDQWEEQLHRKVKYIQLAERNDHSKTEYGSMLGIVTALHFPELSAVLDLPWNWEKIERPNDPASYYMGRISAQGEDHSIVAVAAPRMGMTASAIATMKLIEAFRPRYIGMTGILAGLRGQSSIGDVIAADPSWDYGNGKLVSAGGNPAFKPAPHQIALDSFLRTKLMNMAQDGQVADEIRRSWTGTTIDSILRIHVGPVASGAAVLASTSALESIQTQHRKVVGIEMETYGVFAAAAECTAPQPKAFSLKSVCDFGDEQKNDDGQLYAAYTSARALRVFVERYLCSI